MTTDNIEQETIEARIRAVEDRINGFSANGLSVLDTTSQVFPLNARTVTTTYTMAPRDRVILADGSGGAFTVTLPTPVGKKGQQALTVKRIGAAGNITIATAAGTIDGAATVTLAAQYALRTVVSDGANWHVIASI